MVDAEFCGAGHGWSRVAAVLARRGLLDAAGARALAWAETFGEWIGNTDMHLGNVSLAPGGAGFRLLPLYDMLPMALAPVRGELLEPELQPPIRTPLNEAVWEPTRRAAARYWLALSEDGELSSRFRAFARRHGVRWSRLREAPTPRSR
jgi:hypothetical protein